MERQKQLSKKLIPADARLHNRSLILASLLHRGQLSRSDLAKQTGITKATVSDLVAGLMDDGLVVERGAREAAKPGRPAILLEFNRAHSAVVALDLSSHLSFRGALVNLDSSIALERSVELDGAVGEAALDRARELVAALLKLADGPVLGVSVGTPGRVLDDGHVVDAPALEWDAIDLRAAFADIADLPLLIANDANLAAIAERRFGGGSDDLVLVRIGRGVGAGLLIDGRVRSGSHAIAGEIGHVTVGDGAGPLCPCGRTGCLESWIAAPQLTDARELSLSETELLEALTLAGTHLGIVLAPIVTAVDTDEIVLSGSAELLGGSFRDAVETTLRERTLRGLHPSMPVRLAAAGDTAVLRGAAALLVERELRIA